MSLANSAAPDAAVAGLGLFIPENIASGAANEPSAISADYVIMESADVFVHRLVNNEWGSVDKSVLKPILKNLFFTMYKHKSLVDEFVSLILRNNMSDIQAFLEAHAITDLEDQLAAQGRPLPIRKNYDAMLDLYLNAKNETMAFAILQSLFVSGCETQEEYEDFFETMRELNEKDTLPDWMNVRWNSYNM